MDTIGSRLKMLRVKRGLNVDTIAEAIGVSRATIYNYEKNAREMNFETITTMAKIFNVSLDYLINGTDSPDNIVATTHRLSVIGKIPAGKALEAITDFLDDVYVPENIVAKYGSELFALKVTGDSMSRVLPNSSVAVIKRQNYVENGEIAVVLVDHQDATLKRFFRVDDETVVLKPDSYLEEYKPEIINLKEQPVEILGKVVWYCPSETF